MIDRVGTDRPLRTAGTGARPRPPRLLAAAAVVALAGLLGAGWWFGVRDDGLAQRRTDVAGKGSAVMPFDLTRTTHTFTKTADGGIQTVTAEDPGDTVQVELIRGHLREESAKFSRGEFADPATIHGQDMPGLAELRAGAARVDVRYEELSDGARLTYTTSEAPLVSGVHSWFDAQSADHG